ncbi:MAG: TipAS antibiotic-recognition domain-containing protein [Chloroflexota bacterium]
MGKKKDKQQPVIKPFSEKKQQRYERLARLQYGPELVNESVRRWASYSPAEQEAIHAEGNANYAAVVKAMEAGRTPHDAEVQALVERWQQHIHYFYTPTPEILRGLGESYKDDPEFRAFFEKFHPELPEYLSAAITVYVDALDDAELARLMDEDTGEARH